MIRKLIFLFVIVAASAYPQNVQRIVGGTETTIEQHPDMVAMLFSWGTTGHTQACGGTIINNRAILTAAHCTYGDAPARWRSRVGSTFRNIGGVIYDTAAIINHDQYDTSNLNNDVSIIRTASNIAFSNTVRAGIFAGANYHVADNQEVWVSGWGTLYSNGPSSDQLRHVQVWTINQATCRQRYAERGNEVTDNMLCTGWLDVGGRDACQGDSGGPVYHDGVVIGVTSWGAGCAAGQFPGVNARVQRYPYWINQNA